MLNLSHRERGAIAFGTVLLEGDEFSHDFQLGLIDMVPSELQQVLQVLKRLGQLAQD